MYHIYFAERDSTIHEKYTKRNTGIDQILELKKITSGSIIEGQYQANTYNSRILIDFGTQITDISKSITSGKIGSTARRFHLNLRAMYATDLPISYSIFAYPVSESWDNGNGAYGDIPEGRDGTSWYYRDNYDVQTYWATGSAHSYEEGKGTYESFGGGTWITGSEFESSQSFENESADMRMNITDIVNNWITGSDATKNTTNYGLIIKRSNSDEQSSEILGNIKFFSRDTHTIFVPRLEVSWDDTDHSGTSSFTEVSADTYTPYFKNIRESYREAEITKFRIGVRPEFPTRTYSTSSWYLTEERLPTSSYYSIVDTMTSETMVPFDVSASKINCDTNGNYFKVSLNSFMPDRYYKILLKIEKANGDDTQIHDNGYHFKVVK